LNYRVLDIETVPDLRFWTKNSDLFVEQPVRLPGLGGSSSSGDEASLSFGPDGRLMTMWEPKEQFPPPQTHRVVAMSWVNLSGEDGEYYKYLGYHSVCLWSHGPGDVADAYEARLLREFGEHQAADEGEEAALLVTWNGRGFDLPVINMRSLLHGIPCPWYYGDREVRYRYSEAGHCDLMDVFSDYGASRPMKLGDVVRLIGLPGKSGPISGGDVARLYGRGDDQKDMREVEKYCLCDSLQTALLFARSRVHKGMISMKHYRDVVVPSFLPALGEHLGVKESDLR